MFGHVSPRQPSLVELSYVLGLMGLIVARQSSTMSVIKPALQHPEQISYFAGANNYCWLHFRNGEKKLLAKPISYLESKLPDIIRVHKTVLVNSIYIKSLHQPPRKKMAGEVHLDSGEVFPVSRRRWLQVVEALQNRDKVLTPAEVTRLANEPVAPSEKGNNESTALSVLLVTDDREKAQRVEQMIKAKWAAHGVMTMTQSALLVDLLTQSPEQEHPTLIVLDARTATLERLHTLRRLKEDLHLNQIPIVLLVLPTDQLVIDGYQHQANTVISMPKDYQLFEQTIERILHFWLRTVTLPGAVA